jgi:hypothetical protein
MQREIQIRELTLSVSQPEYGNNSYRIGSLFEGSSARTIEFIVSRGCKK